MTIVKAVHLTQLRSAIDAARILAEPGARTYTDPTITAGVTTVNAAHVSELRTNLDGARAALMLPTLSYTDATIGPGVTVIKAVHFADLRNGVKSWIASSPCALGSRSGSDSL